MVVISSVDLAVRSASFLTSSATTANPRPCSPARAASMAALSASRLVWSAMSLITPAIVEMLAECSPRERIRWDDWFTLSAILPISAEAWLTMPAPRLAVSPASWARAKESRALSAMCSILVVSSSTAAAAEVAASLCCPDWLATLLEVAERDVDSSVMRWALRVILPIIWRRDSCMWPSALSKMPISSSRLV